MGSTSFDWTWLSPAPVNLYIVIGLWTVLLFWTIHVRSMTDGRWQYMYHSIMYGRWQMADGSMTCIDLSLPVYRYMYMYEYTTRQHYCYPGYAYVICTFVYFYFAYPRDLAFLFVTWVLFMRMRICCCWIFAAVVPAQPLSYRSKRRTRSAKNLQSAPAAAQRAHLRASPFSIPLFLPYLLVLRF